MITGSPPCPPGFYLDSGDPNSGLHICTTVLYLLSHGLRPLAGPFCLEYRPGPASRESVGGLLPDSCQGFPFQKEP